MKITHVISSISRKDGGTSTYLGDLLNALPETVKSTLVCYDSPEDLQLLKHIGFKKIALEKKGFNAYSKAVKPIFSTFTTEVFHGNGLWDYPTHAMAVYARKNKIPYMISPHGMLEPYSLTQSQIKKRIALGLYQKKDLRSANCIHATAESEADHIRALGYRNPIAVIPNGINLEEFPDYIESRTSKRKKVLFLSRIHEKKGIEVLISAWKGIDPIVSKGWEVEIVGNGEGVYIESLKALIHSLELDRCISISSPVFGTAKLEKYRSANLFVLPSYSENFGIVVAEALALKVPVITTKGTPWQELNTHNCGLWIDLGEGALKTALQVMLSKSQEELQEMGNNGRRLIEDKYSMTAVAEQMLELYRWILNEAEQPEFVYLP